MCGIAGIWALPGARQSAPMAQVLMQMAAAIRHRGPDEEGFWHDPAAGIGFAHRRLSILDLSPAGSQPMHSRDGRWIIAYNGEIYNHLEMRQRLQNEGRHAGDWGGHSDTETLLACISAWGLEPALQACCGMFALALWDREERSLCLARDRLGEKPLYFGRSGENLVFASELKAIQAHPDFDPAIDHTAAALFLRNSFVPAPRSIFTDVSKLMPGEIARFDHPLESPERKPYWTLIDSIAATADRRARKLPLDAIGREVEASLAPVIASQMLSDVPIGAFLSGGIDSSLIAALMQASSSSPVNSFSIGFEDPRFDETGHAAAVAAHLGTHHTKMIVTERDMLSIAPDISSIFDEPFADSSLLPTVLLSRLTREHVTVALSGDGGDEMFAGYNRHVMGPRLWRAITRTPRPVRKLAGAASSGAERVLASMPGAADWGVRKLGLPVTLPAKLARFGHSFATSDTIAAMYESLLATGPQFNSEGFAGQIAQIEQAAQGLELDSAEKIMLWDAMIYLADDIMVKVDRAAMASSLETRAPFLDLRSIEAAWAVPLEHKIGSLGSKTVLREILYRHVPRALIERPKQGFAIPLDDWLRGGLRDWAESALKSMSEHESMQPFAATISTIWSRHLSGKGQHGNVLFNAIVLSDWIAHNGRQKGHR